LVGVHHSSRSIISTSWLSTVFPRRPAATELGSDDGSIPGSVSGVGTSLWSMVSGSGIRAGAQSTSGRSARQDGIHPFAVVPGFWCLCARIYSSRISTCCAGLR
jgi:hypothetical protein